MSWRSTLGRSCPSSERSFDDRWRRNQPNDQRFRGDGRGEARCRSKSAPRAGHPRRGRLRVTLGHHIFGSPRVPRYPIRPITQVTRRHEHRQSKRERLHLVGRPNSRAIFTDAEHVDYIRKYHTEQVTVPSGYRGEYKNGKGICSMFFELPLAERDALREVANAEIGLCRTFCAVLSGPRSLGCTT